MLSTDRWTIHYAGFVMACCYGIIAYFSLSQSGISLVLFYTCIIIAAIFYIIPLRIETPRLSLVAIMGWAIIFRMLGFFGDPLFEDDFYRYLWDGYQFISHGNPYLKAPEEFFIDPTVSPVFNTILGKINYPEIPTVYGPGLQFLFGLCYWIAPAELWPLKLILISFDLLLIGLLSRIGSVKNILLYAWNPLVIKEIAFTAHIDGLIPLLLIAAWLCKQSGKTYWMAGLLGFVITIKIPALLFAPFLLWKAGWKPVLFCAATITCFYLPFLGESGSDLPALFRFAQSWQFNSALYGLLQFVLPDNTSRYILGIAVIIWILWLWQKDQQHNIMALPRGDLIFAGLIFAAPAINPWYWLWVLPFSVVYPSRWPWITSFALLLSYITGLNLESEALQAYQQPLWVPWIEFGIITIAISMEYQPWISRRNSHNY